jgi:4-amino-4-deoxy-L-arabinose transferase-like glycosyltransferase
MWGLNPFVLGIGHLDGIDLPFTLATLLSVLALVRWLEERTTSRLVLLGLACGAAMLVRYTGPLVLAVAVVSVGVASRRLRAPLIVGAVAVAVVWLFYAAADPAYTFHHANLLPQRYVDGVRALASAHAGAQDAFLLGHHWTGVRWWFWPVNWVIKLPVTLLLAFALTPFFLKRVPSEQKRRVYAAVIPTAVVLAVFTIATPDDRGLRYMLAVVALLCVCIAPLARARRLLPVLLVAGSLAFVAESVPNVFSWTMPPFRPGYKYVTDSNLDWGQDVPDLQRWARGKQPWIACYAPRGTGCIEDVPGARRLRKFTPQSQVHGLVAISSTLQNLLEWHPWLRHEKQIGTVDGTIMLYRVP